MKKIAISYNNQSFRLDFFKSIVKDNYQIVEANGKNELKDLLTNSYHDLSVLVIDNPSNCEYIKELLEYIDNKNNYMFSLPVLILTDALLMENDDLFLKRPVVGIISTSDSERTILARIDNSISFADSTSFDNLSKMLSILPSLIYVKDINGRYAFCSKHWHHVKEQVVSVRGKTDFDIRKDKNNALIARNSDLKVLKTGKGMRYVIKEDDDEGIDYLEIIKEPIKSESGEVYGIIAIVNNVTDQEILRQELREKSITDPLTGVYNRVYFEEIIHEKNQVLNYPLTIISADCDNLKKINDKFGHAAGDLYICYARDAIKNNLPKDSLLFRIGGDEFIALASNTNKQQAAALIDRINKSVDNYKNDNFKLDMSIGCTTLEKKSSSIEQAVIKSDKEMYKVKRQHKNRKK